MSTSQKKRRQDDEDVQSYRDRAQATGFELNHIELPEGITQFRPSKEGKYLVDILPYRAGEGNPNSDSGKLWAERTYYAHFLEGRGFFICNERTKTGDGKCFICEHRRKLANDPKADEDYVRSLASKERQLFNVIDKNDEDKGVQLWDVSTHLFGNYLNKEINAADDEDGIDRFFAMKGGKTLKIVAAKAKAGKWMEYSTIKFLDRDDYDKDILDQVACLDDLFIVPEYKELKKTFLSIGSDEDDDTDDDEKPTKTIKPKNKDEEEDEDDDLPPAWEKGMMVKFVYKKKKLEGKIVKVDEDEELIHVRCDDGEKPHVLDFDDDSLSLVESDEEDEDEDDDEKPTKKKKPTKKSKDEDEEEEEEDEEEDEKPKKKSKSKKKDDDDNEDEDEDEDEDEEKPKSKKKGKKSKDEDDDDWWSDDEDE